MDDSGPSSGTRRHPGVDGRAVDRVARPDRRTSRLRSGARRPRAPRHANVGKALANVVGYRYGHRISHLSIRKSLAAGHWFAHAREIAMKNCSGSDMVSGSGVATAKSGTAPMPTAARVMTSPVRPRAVTFNDGSPPAKVPKAHETVQIHQGQSIMSSQEMVLSRPLRLSHLGCR